MFHTFILKFSLEKPQCGMNMKWWRTIAMALLFFGGSWQIGEAQSYSTKIRKISIEQGLSNRFVKKVFQDSRGFVWMATNYGLNRYDGYSFELFTKENQNLVSNAIYDIYEDGDQNLWVTYSDANGLYLNEIDVININTGEVKRFNDKFKNKIPLLAGDIFDIYQVNTKSIFVLTKDKKIVELGQGAQYKLLFELPYPAHTLQRVLCTDDMIWVVCQDAILEYSRAGELVKTTPIYFQSILDVYLEAGDLHGFAKNKAGDLVVFAKKYEQELEIKSLPLFLESIKELNEYSHVQLAPNGLIWYHDKEYSRILSAEGEVIFDFSSYLPQRTIYSVYFDKNDIIWIATTDGVYMLNIALNKFKRYLSQDDFRPNSTSFSIRGMAIVGEDSLFANTYSGRQLIDLKTGKYTAIADKSVPELAIFKDKTGSLWFCGENTKIQKLDIATNTYQEYECVSGNRYGISSLRPMNTKMHQDQNGRIWMGSSDGLFYLDETQQQFIKYTMYGIDGKYQAINGSRIYDIVEDSSRQVLWLATTTGVYGYQYDKQLVFQHFHTKGAGKNYLPYEYIYTIHRDLQNPSVYWLGTKGGGLIQFNPYHEVKPILDHYTIATGLSDNVIYGILEDDFANLWLSSNYGLMQFNKPSKWINIYLPKDGLTTEEFNSLSYYQDNKGCFYFGTINGINAFDPRDFSTKEVSDIPLHVTAVQQMNNVTSKIEDKTADFFHQQEIVLKPDDNFFSMQLALLDYRDPLSNRYAYRIKEIDKDWKYTNGNEIRFNHLSAGNYTLIIKGQGSDGKWSTSRLEIPIKVLTPFYKTSEFLILAALLVLFIVIGFFRARVFVLAKQQAMLEQKVATRTKDLEQAKLVAEKSSQAKAEFLSVMSHEIRTPMNAVVNMTNFLLQDQPKENQVENLNVLKFSADNLLAIINDVLDFNKIESGKIVFEETPFDMCRLMDSIKYSMEAYATNKEANGKNIVLKTSCDASLDHLLIGDPSRLTQVLNNLISNAMKFTEKGTVFFNIKTITDNEKETELCFEVKDTGIGIALDKQTYIFEMFTQASTDTTRKFGGTGLGLAISQKLITLQGSTIELESELGKGSTFSFKLTFQKGELVQQERKGEQTTPATSVLQGVSVLVVEDNVINVMVVKKFLQKWGVVITRAADGIEAIEAIKSHQFDLVLMDIHMPNMDGYTATQHIRAMEGTYYQQVPIIALTASALADDRNKVFACGMNDIIVKPFVPNELYATMNKYINKDKEE